MTVASVGDVFEGWTGPSIELADERPHGVDCSEDGLRSKQWKEEMGLNVTSEGFATSHEEAVPDEIIVREVMSSKGTNLPSIRITGGASGSCSI